MYMPWRQLRQFLDPASACGGLPPRDLSRIRQGLPPLSIRSARPMGWHGLDSWAKERLAARSEQTYIYKSTSSMAAGSPGSIAGPVAPVADGDVGQLAIAGVSTD